jgi:hypothetical protein
MRRILVRLASWNRTAVGIATSVLVIAVWGWFSTWRDPGKTARAECEQLYARAATAADTALVDGMLGGGGSKYGPWNCGLLRRAEKP